MGFRIITVHVEPTRPLPEDSPDAGVAGRYPVEVDASLSPEEAEAAAIEAFYETVELVDRDHFTVRVR